MMVRITTISAYYNGLFGKNTKYGNSLMRRYPRITTYVRTMYSNNICPVCRRKYATKYSLEGHLHRSDCGYVLERLILYLLQKMGEDQVLRQMALELGLNIPIP